MRFPVFAGGIGPLDSKGRGVVAAIDVPISCGGTAVNPGDYAFGDVDGVCIVPRRLAKECFARAFDKVASENTVRRELRRGDRLSAVFKRHGIL